MSPHIKRCLVLLLCAVIAGGLLFQAPQALADLTSLEPYDFSVEPVDGSTIRLQWNRKTGVEGVQIFRADSPGGPFAMIGAAYDIVWHDTGLTAGQPYYYRLRAFRADELGDETVTKSAMPLGAPNVTGMSEMAFVDGVPCTTVTISSVAEAEGYRLYLGAGEDYVGDPLLSMAGTEAVCALPDEPGSYYFIARAYKTGGDGFEYEGPFGSAILFTVAGDGLAIGSDFGVFSIDGSTIALKWNKPADAEGAQVYRAEDEGGPFVLAGIANEAVWFDAGLTAGRLYSYRLRAFRGDEVGEESTVKSCVPLDAPNVTGVSDDHTDESGWIHVNVSWNAVAEADGYKLCRGDSGSPLYGLRATTADTAAEDVLPGETASYWYTVLAYKVHDGKEYEGPLGDAYPYSVLFAESGFVTEFSWRTETPTRIPPETPPTPTPTPRRFILPRATKTPGLHIHTPTPKPTKVIKPTPTPTKVIKSTPTPQPTKFSKPTPTPTLVLKTITPPPIFTIMLVIKPTPAPTPKPTIGFHK
jgi:hypothetical protein